MDRTILLDNYCFSEKVFHSAGLAQIKSQPPINDVNNPAYKLWETKPPSMVLQLYLHSPHSGTDTASGVHQSQSTRKVSLQGRSGPETIAMYCSLVWQLQFPPGWDPIGGPVDRRSGEQMMRLMALMCEIYKEDFNEVKQFFHQFDTEADPAERPSVRDPLGDPSVGMPDADPGGDGRTKGKPTPASDGDSMEPSNPATRGAD